MVAISRVQAVFSGSGVVGPSAASFYTTGQVDDFRPPLITLWQVFKLQMPAAVTVTIPSSGEVFESSTGDVLGTWSHGTTSTFPGSGSGAFARGVGLRVSWLTDGHTNNRKVRGTTYVVPCTSATYDTDGTVQGAIITDWTTHIGTFITATVTDFSIWTRPKNNAGGKLQNVTGGQVPDAITTLRSRRT